MGVQKIVVCVYYKICNFEHIVPRFSWAHMYLTAALWSHVVQQRTNIKSVSLTLNVLKHWSQGRYWFNWKRPEKGHLNQYFVGLDKEDEAKRWTDDTVNNLQHNDGKRGKGGKGVMAEDRELKNQKKGPTTTLAGPGCRVLFLFRYCCSTSSTRQGLQVGHTFGSHTKTLRLFPYRTYGEHLVSKIFKKHWHSSQHRGGVAVICQRSHSFIDVIISPFRPNFWTF